MFTGYGFIDHSMYVQYQEYAEMAAGSPEAASKALNLQTVKHEDAYGFATELNSSIRAARNGVVEEFFVSVVRSSNTNTFDIYFYDEDSIFLGSSVSVPAEEVLTEGYALIDDWRELIKNRPSWRD